MTLLNGVRYPRARPGTQRLGRPGDAGNGLGGLAAGAPPPPRVRLWPFTLFETATGDAIATSPSFLGPAVLDRLFLLWLDDNAEGRPAITLWYGASQPTSRNGATAIDLDLGSPIFADGVIQSEVASQYQGPHRHLPAQSYGNNSQHEVFPLGYAITLPRFQVSVILGTAGPGNHALDGYLRVLESVAADELFRYV